MKKPDDSATTRAAAPGNDVKAYSIDHVGIAVKSIEQALRFYRDQLHMDVAGTEEVSAEKVRVALLPIGESRIELIEPAADDSPVGRFLAKRGEGLHHIAVKVENITTAMESMKAAGVVFVNNEPGTGAGGHAYAFVHPKSAGGVLVELVEEQPRGV